MSWDGGWWDGSGAATPAMAANVCVLVPRSSCMGRLHGLTHIRDCVIVVCKNKLAHPHIAHIHICWHPRCEDIPIFPLRLCTYDRISNFKFQTIVCMRVGGGTVAGITSTTQDCLCGGSKRALLPDMVDVPSGEACYTWRQIQPHASSHTHTG